MECYRHSGVTAAAMCGSCNRALCRDCSERFIPIVCEHCVYASADEDHRRAGSSMTMAILPFIIIPSIWILFPILSIVVEFITGGFFIGSDLPSWKAVGITLLASYIVSSAIIGIRVMLDREASKPYVEDYYYRERDDDQFFLEIVVKLIIGIVIGVFIAPFHYSSLRKETKRCKEIKADILANEF